MHDSVRDIWLEFNDPLEGRVAKPYPDILGLVTVGVGNLIDAPGVKDPNDAWTRVSKMVLGLPWLLDSGAPASSAAVAKAWMAVKLDTLSAQLGWRRAAALPENVIHLSDEAIDDLVMQKLDENDAIFAASFPHWENYSADAQLAVHSMGWAMGPGFLAKFPRFTAAFKSGDFYRAARECKIYPERGTVVVRNRRNVACLLNASRRGSGDDVGELIYPASA